MVFKRFYLNVMKTGCRRFNLSSITKSFIPVNDYNRHTNALETCTSNSMYIFLSLTATSAK